MKTSTKIITTVLLLVALTGVGAADYYFAGREYAASLTGTEPTPGTDTGVAKAEGPDVQQTLASMNLITQASEDLTFLAQVSNDQTVKTFVVLQGNDRVGSVSWIDGGAKQAFIALKSALLSAFSAKVENLSDKTYQDAGLPTRNVLTFRDPALSEETLTFVRVRERLYEFHTADTGTVMQQVIESLTTR